LKIQPEEFKADVSLKRGVSYNWQNAGFASLNFGIMVRTLH